MITTINRTRLTNWIESLVYNPDHKESGYHSGWHWRVIDRSPTVYIDFDGDDYDVFFENGGTKHFIITFHAVDQYETISKMATKYINHGIERIV
jgi:hypothetical protein